MLPVPAAALAVDENAGETGDDVGASKASEVDEDKDDQGSERKKAKHCKPGEKRRLRSSTRRRGTRIRRIPRRIRRICWIPRRHVVRRAATVHAWIDRVAGIATLAIIALFASWAAAAASSVADGSGSGAAGWC